MQKEQNKTKQAKQISSKKSSDAVKPQKRQSAKSILTKEELSYYKWRKRLAISIFILALCALVCITVYLLGVLATPVAILIWTMILVFLLRGIVNKLEQKGVNRVIGTIVAYVVMLLVILLIGLFMFSPVFGFADQVKNIFENLPRYAARCAEFGKQLYFKYGSYLQNENVQKWINDTTAALGSMGGSIASASANGILAAGGFLGNMFMSFGIALVIAFWMLIELPKMGREVNRFISDKYKEDSQMWYMSFTQVMAGFIKGTFLQCAIIGFVSGLVFWILGIGNPGALGCIVGVLNIIPIFGPILGAAIALIGGIFTGIIPAILALVIISAIQGFVYTFISPKIMSNSCNIHPVLILLALTAGGAIGGVMSGPIGGLVGMLLAIPAVAVVKSLFVYYYEKRTGVRIVSKEGFLFQGDPHDTEEANPFFDALSMSPEEYEKKFVKPKEELKKLQASKKNK